jgi:thioesterase domain-containing protein
MALESIPANYGIPSRQKAEALLVDLHSSGMEIRIDGARLKIEGPRGRLDTRLKHRVMVLRQELVQILSENGGNGVVAERGVLEERVGSDQVIDSWDTHCLIPINLGTSRSILFCVHPADGSMGGYRMLSAAIGRDQTVFSFQIPWYERAKTRLESVVHMAGYYAKQIRLCQSDGPYFICGWSAGGCIAYDLACQLMAQGCDVAHLSLIDTSFPGPISVRVQWDLFRGIVLGPAAATVELNDEFWLLSHPARVRHMFELGQLHNGRVYPPGYPYEMFRIHSQVFFSVNIACSAYVPNIFPGQLTYFLCGQNLDRATPWSRVATGGITVISVPGQHTTVMDVPYVEDVGEKLRTCLSQAGAV